MTGGGGGIEILFSSCQIHDGCQTLAHGPDMDCSVIIFGQRGEITPRSGLPVLDSTCTKSHNALLVFSRVSQEEKFIEGYDDFMCI